MEAGVTTMLFGAGVGASTDCVGTPPADNYWWITKAQRYYNNPVIIKPDNLKPIYEKEDVNEDGKINNLDLQAVGNLYNIKLSSSNWNSKYDINKDNIIDLFDLVLINKKVI